MNLFSVQKTLFIVFISCLFFSCKKSGTDNTPVTEGTIIVPASTPINGSVVVKLIDENGAPVNNATVKIGTNTYLTDANGVISTGTITLDKYVSVVTVTKQGYYKAYRSFCATASKNYVVIKLIKRTLANSFNSSAATTISLTNGTQISFLANSFVIKSSGAVYNGTVNVYADYIDPTAADISTTVPGSLVGIDGSKLYALQSKAMIAVELESSGGEALQLVSASPAKIKMPIPVSLQASAPSSIDTWSLNDQGLWSKEGTANKNGNAYDFDATHFSFWNLDVPIDAVYLSINVKDQSAQNLANAVIELQAGASSGYGTTYGYTDNEGNVAGIVPKNVLLQLSVNFAAITCGNALYTQTVGPLTADASLNIVATVPASINLTVKGTVTNCAGLAATSGYIYIQKDDDSIHQVIANVVNGQFSADIPHCAAVSNIKILTYAGVIPQQPQVLTFPVSSSLLNVGNVVLCDSAYQGYIMYNIDATHYTHIEDRNGTLVWSLYYPSLSSTVISVSDPGTTVTTYLSAGFSGNTVGTFPYDQSVLLSIENFTTNNIVSNTASVTFTSYGAIGEYVTGSFNMPFTDASSISHTCTGTFKLKRFQ